VRALLLAAGLGTRLAPITNTIPKCLVPIAGRPLLDHWLALLSGADVRNILINLHYRADQVRKYVANAHYPVNITLVEEAELLGTGGTLLKNMDYFAGEAVLVVHADNLSLFDVGAFAERFATRERGIEITMMTFETDVPQSCGIVELDARGAVIAFHEKQPNPPGNLANGAVYIISPAVIQFIAGLCKDQVDFSTEVLPHFMGRINTFHNSIYHRDIGTPESLRLAEREYPEAAKLFRSSGRHELS
jgi:mannose-1-phosphate guanylyltransferase